MFQHQIWLFTLTCSVYTNRLHDRICRAFSCHVFNFEKQTQDKHMTVGLCSVVSMCNFEVDIDGGNVKPDQDYIYEPHLGSC